MPQGRRTLFAVARPATLVFALVFVSVLASSLGSGAAAAQPDPAKDDAAAKALTTTDDGRPAVAQSPLEADVYDGLSRTWRRFVELLDKEDFAEILVRVDQLDEIRRDAGLPNLPDAAHVLLRAALHRAEARDIATARHLAQAAMRIAPDLPEPHYVMATLLWRESKGQVGSSFSHVFRGWLKEWTHLPSRMRLLANRLSLGILTWLILLFVVALVQLRRHFPTLTHDVGHLFPRGVTPFQAALFTLLLLFTPLFLSLGVLTLLLLWIVAMWWYQNRQERVVTVLLLVGVFLTPFVARVSTNAVAFFTSPLAIHYSCLDGPCSEPEVAWLEHTCRATPAAALPCYTLAVVRARQGAHAPPLLDDALRLLEPLRNETGPIGRAVQVAYGNALQAKAVAHCTFQRRIGGSQLDATYKKLASEAVAAYDAAASLGAGPVATYDKSLMLRRLGDGAGADAALEAATGSGDELILDLQREAAEDPLVGPCSESFNPNRRLLPADLPARSLFVAGLGAMPLSEIELPLLDDVLLGRLKLPMLLGVGVALVALLVLLAMLRRRARPSRRCVTCNRVGCVHCRRELEHLDICDECLFIRVKGSFVDAKELWFRERRIQQEHDARRRVSRLLTFLAPGVGHLYRGWAVSGFVLLGLFVAFGLNALATEGIAPETALVPHGARAVATIGWATAAGIVYLVSLVSIYRRK